MAPSDHRLLRLLQLNLDSFQLLHNHTSQPSFITSTAQVHHHASPFYRVSGSITCSSNPIDSCSS